MYPFLRALRQNRIPTDLFQFDELMIVQPKLDGIWLKLDIKTLQGKTKEGKVYDLYCLQAFYDLKYFYSYHKFDIKYLIGELCYIDPDTKLITRNRHKVMDFLLRHQGWEEIMPNIVLVVFDVILHRDYVNTFNKSDLHFEHDETYVSVFERFIEQNYHELLKNPYIRIMESQEVTYGKLDFIENYFNKKYDHLEGLVLRRYKSIHPNFMRNAFRRIHPDWFKVKPVYDATLKCVAIKPHSKNPDLVGALILETSDGILRVSIGSGLTKEQRESKDFLNNLIEVEYEDLIEKSKLFVHPVVKYIRRDGEVDSWEKLISRRK